VPAAARKPQTVVGNVVDTEMFSLSDNALQNGKKRILHVSTIENKAKNIMGILHAIQKISTQRTDFELNIVHDYENEEAMRFVRDNGLENTVHFLGRKTPEEIAALLRQSDFFLLFSNYENQPCVLLESFCTGTPVITTPVGGILEIADAENAVIVTPKDDEQLVQKVNFMLDNSRDFNPAEIRRHALGICSPEVVGRKWEEVYLKALGNRH
jgi:glycosyltransferase involved in cell wall biosynthesis